MAKLYGMKKTLNIEDELFEEAKAASGAATDTETVRLGLRRWCAVLRMNACKLFAALSLTRKIFPDAAKNQIQDVKLPNGFSRHFGLDSVPC